MSIKEKPTEKKKINDQGTFTKFPNILFDECNLPETAQIIFMRLCRHVCHKNNVFVGSIRKLSNLVRISKSTVERMLPRLEESHYIKKEWDEERKQMIIHVLMAPLWEQNKSRTEPTPDLGPHNSIVVPIWDTREINYLNYDAFVPEWDDLMEAVNNPVPKRDKFVPNWDRSGSNWDKSVPPSSSNVGTTTITTITTETTRESIAHVSDDNAPTPSLSESNSPSSLQETIEESTPAPSDEQSSKQESSSSHSQSTAPSSQQKAKQAPSEQGKKTTAKPDKPVKPAKVELTTEFANDDERSMWEKLSAKERTFYARMNTQERAIYTGWCSLFKKSRHPLGEATFDACRTLGTSNYSSETLDDIRKWCFATDKKTPKYPNGYHRENGVKLWHIAEKAPDWELIQEMGPAPRGNLSERRTQAGIKTGTHVGSSMPPQPKPAATPEQLNEIERKMIEMGIKPATRKGA